MQFGHHISRVVCYDFSKTSIVFFRINPKIFWITILLNGKRHFLLTCKMSRYRTMLLLKCKRQYLLTCKVSRYCLLACTAVDLIGYIVGSMLGDPPFNAKMVIRVPVCPDLLHQSVSRFHNKNTFIQCFNSGPVYLVWTVETLK